MKSGWKQQKVRGIASSRSPEMVARILDRHRAAKDQPHAYSSGIAFTSGTP